MRKVTSLYLCTALIIGGAYVVRSATQPAPAAAPAAAAPAFADGADPSSLAETDRLITAFEAQAAHHPNALGLTFLGRLYLQRAKITADTGSYAQALTALEQAVRRSPRDPEARDLLAGARFSTHDFQGAWKLSEQVLAGFPTDPAALALAGDAEVELGDVQSATRSYRGLARVLPGSAGLLARRARLAFLTGDVSTARSLADKAITASRHHGDFGTTLAFYSVLAGRIELDSGRYASSVQRYRDALAAAPGWHVALSGLARASAATGDLKGAIRLYQRAIDVVPQPDYLAALGDLQSLTGQRAQAADSYGAVGLIARLSALNHQLYDRLFAVYDADHDTDVATAVTIARASLRTRRDVYGWDVYAWALYRAGRFTEAAQADAHALALGTPDAGLLYHAGLIAAARHEDAAARSLLRRALTISPEFDPLQAPRARAALARLR